jgi:hypothetical protein
LWYAPQVNGGVERRIDSALTGTDTTLEKYLPGSAIQGIIDLTELRPHSLDPHTAVTLSKPAKNGRLKHGSARASI